MASVKRKACRSLSSSSLSQIWKHHTTKTSIQKNVFCSDQNKLGNHSGKRFQLHSKIIRRYQRGGKKPHFSVWGVNRPLGAQSPSLALGCEVTDPSSRQTQWGRWNLTPGPIAFFAHLSLVIALSLRRVGVVNAGSPSTGHVGGLAMFPRRTRGAQPTVQGRRLWAITSRIRSTPLGELSADRKCWRAKRRLAPWSNGALDTALWREPVLGPGRSLWARLVCSQPWGSYW